jgi:hypothetical protein
MQYFVEICGFAICRLIRKNLRIFDVKTGISEKFADWLLRNEPKNLRICDLRTSKESLLAHLWQFHTINDTGIYLPCAATGPPYSRYLSDSKFLPRLCRHFLSIQVIVKQK